MKRWISAESVEAITQPAPIVMESRMVVRSLIAAVCAAEMAPAVMMNVEDAICHV
jgi:hypothetical protein